VEAQLRAAIQQTLVRLAASSPVLTQPTRPEKLYEAWVFTCVVRALGRLGATMQVRDSGDNAAPNLLFRLAPGLIYSPTTASSFVFLTYNGRAYEIHHGVRVQGRSSVLHELDICIIDRDEANRCRKNSINPRQARTRLLIECKFYGATLPLELGREFLGLGKEFNMRIKTLVSNAESDDVHRLVSRHQGTANFRIAPTSPAETNRFVAWMETEIKQVLL